MSAASAVLIAAVALLATLCGPPPPSPEAREREQILMELPVKDLTVPGGQLQGEFSDSGHKDEGGPFYDGPVEVRRIYSYTGDPSAACEAIAAGLDRLGWIPGSRGDCQGDFNDPNERQRIQGRLICERFMVGVDVRIYGDDWVNEHQRETIQVELSAPYPGEEPTPPIPPDAVPLDCVPDET